MSHRTNTRTLHILLVWIDVRAGVRHNNASKQYTVETQIKVTHWQRNHQVEMRVFSVTSVSNDQDN